MTPKRSRGFQSKLPTSPTNPAPSHFLSLSLPLSHFSSFFLRASIMISVSLALAVFPFRLPCRVGFPFYVPRHTLLKETEFDVRASVARNVSLNVFTFFLLWIIVPRNLKFIKYTRFTWAGPRSRFTHSPSPKSQLIARRATLEHRRKP